MSTEENLTVYVPSSYSNGPEAAFTDKAEAEQYRQSHPDLEGIWVLVLNQWPAE